MTRVPIAYGGVEYLDRALALQAGAVAPAGIDFNYVVVPELATCFAGSRNLPNDAAEMSATSYS
jgi:hypothetical protein